MNLSVDCEICCNSFDTLKFIPFVGVCGHTFCEQCLNKLKKNHFNKVSCPFCRINLNFPLSRNYALISLLESKNNTSSTSSCSSSTCTLKNIEDKNEKKENYSNNNKENNKIISTNNNERNENQMNGLNSTTSTIISTHSTKIKIKTPQTVPFVNNQQNISLNSRNNNNINLIEEENQERVFPPLKTSHQLFPCSHLTSTCWLPPHVVLSTPLSPAASYTPVSLHSMIKDYTFITTNL